ncbi:non-oxidative hydroxyarylic acid decarboxylases subunit D [Saccharopolyspora sp. ASAGF58]|uniref:non-oxidative hydroxyarylic acid decarboxylases subunit D n=1 Tax=Saccharopolyspora sp. ASAGF58 TaxID=2719023 RepID=UPI00352FF84E
MSTPDCCPRCRSLDPDVLSVSPVANCWIVYKCGVCHYSWRSTEPAQVTTAAMYPEAFRINPRDISDFAVMPPIPDLRLS